MPKPLRLFLFAAALSLLVTGLVFARSMQQGEYCQIPAEAVIKGTLFTLCQNLEIAGRVEGNVIGIGLRTAITGEIGRNVYLAGLELDLSGDINGDLHYVGLTMHVAAPEDPPQEPVRGQIIFAALSAQIDETVAIPGPITGLGYQLLIDGEVNGEISYWGSAFVLNSAVNGDVYAAVGNPASVATDLQTLLLPLDIELSVVAPGLSIASAARIQGQLNYSGPVEAEIAGAVDGPIAYHSTIPAIIPIAPEQDLAHLFLDQFRRELAVLLTIGLLGLTFAPKPFRSPLSHLRRRPVSSFVIGMLLFIVSFPITLIMILVSAILILALALLQLDGVLLVIGSLLILADFSIIGIFYFVAILVARAVFSFGIGRLVLQIASERGAARQRPRLCLLIGAVLLAFLTSLPEVGFLFNALALFLGLGAIASTVTDWLHAIRGNGLSPQADSALVRDASNALPRPAAGDSGNQPGIRRQRNALLPQRSEAVGLDDLPDGFDPERFFSTD